MFEGLEKGRGLGGGGGGKNTTWREMSVISRQIGLRHDRTSFDKKIQKKKRRRPTHGFLHLNLKSLVRQAHERSWNLMYFRLRFFLAISVLATSWKKTRTERLKNFFSVIAQTSLKRYSERLLLFELSSSLSRIDDVFFKFGEKSNNPHIALRRKDVFSSLHRSLRPRSYRQFSFARTSSSRTLSICWLCFGCACIHTFSSYWACLVVIETIEKPV